MQGTLACTNRTEPLMTKLSLSFLPALILASTPIVACAQQAPSGADMNALNMQFPL